MIAINVAANLAGRFWSMLISLAVVPVYLKLLGIEAYGLVGFFVLLQSIMGFLDFGMSLTLNREFARLSTAEDSASSLRNCLRTFETIYWALALAGGLFVVGAADVIATHWLSASRIPHADAVLSLRAMGVAVALQAPMALYQGGLLGLQKHVRLNAALIAGSSVRALGAVGCLLLVGARIDVFFIWQIVASAVATSLMVVLLWRAMPRAPAAPRFDLGYVRSSARFALVVSGNALVGLALTQMDKVMLSALVSLEEFGYYTLAATAASVLWALITPVNTAFYPRFVGAYVAGRTDELGLLYRTACQLAAAIVVPTAAVLACFGFQVINLWTHDVQAASKVSPILVPLLIGTTLNGVTSVASYLQSAMGWPGLVFKTNVVLAVVLVPAIITVVPVYGAVGAAWIWVCINSIYVVVTVPLMHRRVLQGDYLRWLLRDVCLPSAAIVAIATTARAALPENTSVPMLATSLPLLWVVCVASGILICPDLRARLLAQSRKVAGHAGKPPRSPPMRQG